MPLLNLAGGAGRMVGRARRGESGAGGGSLLFASDWSTATGITAAAVTDGGKWARAHGDRAEFSVISSAGLDFPTANVLRCEYNNSAYGIGRTFYRENGVVAEIPVGQTLYRRIYWRYGLTSGVNPGSSNHPLESTSYDNGLNDPRPLAWAMYNSDPYPVAFNAHWLMTYDQLPDFPARAHRWEVWLTPDVTYRLEWGMTRFSDEVDGSARWRIQARIYTSDDVLLYGPDGFVCGRSGHGETMAANPGQPNCATPAGYRTLAISGTQFGYQGGYEYAGEYCWWGGFAASMQDWCGAYQPGEET